LTYTAVVVNLNLDQEMEIHWARGYFVSTVGLDEAIVRAYIRNQEDEDERYDQMKPECNRLLGRLTVLWVPLRRSPNKPPALPGVI
jgi:hypothetical protein